MEQNEKGKKIKYLGIQYREQLEARRVIPTMTQDELIKKWGNVVAKEK